MAQNQGDEQQPFDEALQWPVFDFQASITPQFAIANTMDENQGDNQQPLDSALQLLRFEGSEGWDWR